MVSAAENPPAFIVSTGRAGSNMLARVLALHPDLCVLHEPKPHMNAEAYARWAETHGVSYIRNRIQQKRSRLLEQVQQNRYRYVESSHYCSHLIPDLRTLYRARFIYLYRNGRDFVRSGLERAWWYGKLTPEGSSLKEYINIFLRRRYLIDLGWSYLDHQLDPPRRFETRFEKITWLWTEINEVIQQALETLPSSAHMAVRLEDMDADQLDEVMAFLGVEVDEEQRGNMMNLMQKRPNRTEERTVPPPEAWSEEWTYRFTEIAGSMMTRLGYD